MLSRRSFCLLGAAATLPRPARAVSKVRMAVVGGNFGAAFHWHLHPASEVSAVCDLREDRVARLKKTYNPNARGYSSYDEMLATGGFDAVALFTPVPLHAEMVIQALAAGFHVISAVPAAHTLADAERVLAAVKKSAATYMMAETSFYRPEVIWAREAQQEKKFGTIFFSEAEYYHQGLFHLWYDEQHRPTWRYGAPPLHYPTHATSMVVSVTGERLVEATATGYGDARPELARQPVQESLPGRSGNVPDLRRTFGAHRHLPRYRDRRRRARRVVRHQTDLPHAAARRHRGRHRPRRREDGKFPPAGLLGPAA